MFNKKYGSRVSVFVALAYICIYIYVYILVHVFVLLMEEILHESELIGSSSHYLQGFIHPR